jgi:hypothetical protein
MAELCYNCAANQLLLVDMGALDSESDLSNRTQFLLPAGLVELLGSPAALQSKEVSANACLALVRITDKQPTIAEKLCGVANVCESESCVRLHTTVEILHVLSTYAMLRLQM